MVVTRLIYHTFQFGFNVVCFTDDLFGHRLFLNLLWGKHIYRIKIYSQPIPNWLFLIESNKYIEILNS